MIIFLYGQDSYRSRQKLEEVISHYKSSGKSGLSLMYVDALKVNFSDFYDQFKISSMFAEKKLVILKNVFAGSSTHSNASGQAGSGQAKKFQEEFYEEIKSLENMQDVVVVYEDGECDKRLKLFKSLLKECKCQEFALLDGRQLKAWTQKELEKLRGKINLDAMDLLISYVGADLWRLSGELKKLANFTAGDVSAKQGRSIRKDDVEALVRPNVENDIFKTIDALATKNKKQALLLLKKHLDGGEAPLYLLSMIGWQFRNLLMVKELAEKGLMYASIEKKSGLHPFVVKKNYFMCSQFSFEELKKIYRRIFQIDSDIKTGKVEAETALDLLVAQI